MNKKMRRVISALLAFILAFTSAKAEVIRTKADETADPVSITKTVSDFAVNADGKTEATVTLDINVGTKEVSSYSQYDIVMLLDASSSMKNYINSIKKAADSFIDNLKASKAGENINIAAYSFDQNVKKLYPKNGFADLNATFDLSAYKANTGHGTMIAAAVKEAENLFASSGRADAKKVIVLFSDGDQYNNNGGSKEELTFVQEAMAAKNNGIDIYSIDYSSKDVFKVAMLLASSEDTSKLYTGELKEDADNYFYTGKNTNNTKKITFPKSFNYKGYYNTTALSEEALKKAFVKVSSAIIEVIGLNARIEDPVPELFAPVLDGNSPKLVSASAGITASFKENDGLYTLVLNLGEKLTAGSYQVVYKVELQDGVSIDEFLDKYQDENKDEVTVPFDKATLSYTPSDENGEAQVGSGETEVKSEIDDADITVYTVRFFNGNTLLKTENVYAREGATAPAAPAKASVKNGHFTTNYTFAGWDKDFTNVQSDLDVNATFTSEDVEDQWYTVRFFNGDVQIGESQKVYAGEDATAPADPTKASETDGHFTTVYTFAGWDKDFTNVQSNLDVNATFTSEDVEDQWYTVRFFNGDVQIGESQKVYAGEDATAPADPAKDSVKIDHTTTVYTFTGWDKAFTNIQADTDVFAEFDALEVDDDQFTVTYEVIANGAEGFTVPAAAAFYAGDEVTVADVLAVSGYTFEGWNGIETIDGKFTMPAANVVLTGSFSINTYVVNFYVDGQLLKTETVNYGGFATAPVVTVPETETTETQVTTYSFSGWDKEFGFVTENIDVNGKIDSITTDIEPIDEPEIPEDEPIDEPEIPKDDPIPQTGDNNSVVVFGLTAIIAMAALLFASKKETEENA